MTASQPESHAPSVQQGHGCESRPAGTAAGERGLEPGTLPALDERQLAILALEKRRFKYQGSKEQAIGRLGFTPVAYYQQLNALIDNPVAIATEPVLTARLRQQRDLLT